MVLEQDAQSEQMSESLAAPGLTATAQTLLELFAQRLGGSAAPRGSGFLHRLVVQVVAVVLKVAHFPFEFDLLCGRAHGGGPRAVVPSGARRAPRGPPAGT